MRNWPAFGLFLSERVEAALSDGPAARGVFHHTGLCPRSFPIGSRPRPAPPKAGAFPVSEGIWGLRSLERATPLIAEAGHGVRMPFAGACGRRIFQEAVQQDAFRDGKAAIPAREGIKAIPHGREGR